MIKNYKQQKAIALYLDGIGLKDEKFEIKNIFIMTESSLINVGVKIENPKYYHKDSYLLKKRFLYRIMNNLSLELDPLENIKVDNLRVSVIEGMTL